MKVVWMLFPICNFCNSCKLELSVNLWVHQKVKVLLYSCRICSYHIEQHFEFVRSVASLKFKGNQINGPQTRFQAQNKQKREAAVETLNRYKQHY